jgi:threonine aldolase
MHFASDNTAGASGPVLAAIAAANGGSMTSYGADDLMAKVEAAFRDLFETDLAVLLVPTGTAANMLALAALCPPFGNVYAHEEAHVVVDECGAIGYATGGARIVTIPGRGGKMTPAALENALAGARGVHSGLPAALSITQATELGQIYTPAEIAALTAVARRRGLGVHMDGARFANALVALGAAPADVTWRAGVDILSFGATKNGCLMGEAIVAFDRSRLEALAYRRKQAGHLVSKGRLLSAQMLAHLEGGHWRDLAVHANAMARRLAEGIEASGVARLAAPVEANEVFAVLPASDAAALEARGARFFRWGSVSYARPPGPGEEAIRLVASFATTPADVDALLAALSAVGRRPALQEA